MLTAIRKVPAFTWYGILVAAYIILSLSVPIDSHALHMLHLSSVEYRVFIFAVIVPYTLIWLAAFYAYNNMQSYAKRIHTSPEGLAFKQLANGILVMAWGLAIPAILSVILNAIAAQHYGFKGTATIINNYATLLVPLIAFSYISSGTRRLSDSLHSRPSLVGVRLFVIAFVTMGVFYCYLTLRARFLHGDPYHLPTVLTLLTIVIPYLFAWFMGLLATLELTMYATKIHGLLYKRSLNMLASGIAMVIVSSIFIQYITVIFAYKGNFTLGILLVLIYILLIGEAIGFVLISTGSKRLKRIEEI